MNIRRIHVSPVDSRHMVEVWENKVTGERLFMPYYSRKGRSWSSYKKQGINVVCKSYASAMKYIRRGSKETQPRALQSTLW